MDKGNAPPGRGKMREDGFELCICGRLTDPDDVDLLAAVVGLLQERHRAALERRASDDENTTS